MLQKPDSGPQLKEWAHALKRFRLVVYLAYLFVSFMLTILMLAGDIEMNPGPTSSLFGDGKDKEVIPGTVHQGSIKYLARLSAGHSCMANSLVALAYATIFEVGSWNKSVVNNILDFGAELYEKLYPSRSDKSSAFFQITDLKTSFSLKEKHFTCNPESSMVGYLNMESNDRNGVLYTLETAIISGFGISPHCIYIHNGYGIAVFTASNMFHVFDPHSRNLEGLPTPNGQAVLVILCSVKSLCIHPAIV